MAKLSANGEEVGRLDFLLKRKSYRTNGKILIDYGSGWKQHATVKPGFTPEQVYQLARENQIKVHNERPCFSRYAKALHRATSIKNWSLVHEAIKLMPTDPDGIWSSFEDMPWYGVSLDFEDIAELCKLYLNFEAEGKMLAGDPS